jgi:hypothetical protein
MSPLRQRAPITGRYREQAQTFVIVRQDSYRLPTACNPNVEETYWVPEPALLLRARVQAGCETSRRETAAVKMDGMVQCVQVRAVLEVVL